MASSSASRFREDRNRIPCEKVGFANQIFADYYIEKLSRISTRTRVPVRSYLCNRCNLWHLTSQPHYLEAKVLELTEQLEKVTAELNILKDKSKKEERIAARVDQRVKEASIRAERQNEEMKQLRKEKSDLITRLHQSVRKD